MTTKVKMKKDSDYMDFRLKKMKAFLHNKYGAGSLGILKRIDGYENSEERKKRRSLVRELHKIGFSLREIGTLMDLTGQAVNSIIKSTAKYKQRKSKKDDLQAKLF
ncbi:MAG: hypothetical protein V1690_03325 [Candidatus Moraniibacteriota bacterium]